MENPPDFWDGVLRRLGSDVPPIALTTWLQPLQAEVRDRALRLHCPSAFHRERVRSRFLAQIERHASEEYGRPIRVDLAVAAPPPARPSPASASAPAAERPAAPGGGIARSRSALAAATAPSEPEAAPRRREPLPFTFDNFVVGPCNALAREASLALAQQRQRTLTPLYLAGPSGLGKTHLARAVLHEAQRRGASAARYESAESFTNGFLSALRRRETEAFKRRYREQCDLLVLEDVQILAQKTATQLELFHTLVHLMNAGVDVVLTGDRLPREIDGLDARLRSQLSAGMVAELQPPDADLRRAILRAKAAAGGVRLPEECLDLLADSVRGSVRDLEGCLIQVVASASLLKRPIDLDLTRAALRKLLPHEETRARLDSERVIDCVAQFFGLTREALASRSRRREVQTPRQLAMYLCRRYTGASLSEIARHFGREHPAVANAVQNVERAVLERAPLRYQLEELIRRLDLLR